MVDIAIGFKHNIIYGNISTKEKTKGLIFFQQKGDELKVKRNKQMEEDFDQNDDNKRHLLNFYRNQDYGRFFELKTCGNKKGK